MSPDHDWLGRDGVLWEACLYMGVCMVSTQNFYGRKRPASWPWVLENGAEELLLPEGVF